MVEVSAQFKYDGQRLIQAIARDVSEQRALTDRMVQADKMVLLGQLSAGVAHEIRNPLAAIDLNLQVLQRKADPDSVEAIYLDTAMQGVERISKIIDATLNFAHPGITTTQSEDINVIIRNSLDLVASTFGRKTISVNLSLAENLPAISLDYKQIQQVFINLFTNAADAIRAKGEISIQSYRELITRRGDQFVVVAICDTRIGISEEDMTKIFDPFHSKSRRNRFRTTYYPKNNLSTWRQYRRRKYRWKRGTTFYVKLPVVQNT